MHERGPKLNPPYAQGSTSSEVFHRSGSNFLGFLKYFSLQWLGRSSILSPVPFMMGILSIFVSWTTSLRKMLEAGPYMRVTSICTHSKYRSSFRFPNVISSAVGILASTSCLSLASTSGFSLRQQKIMVVKRLLESLPAAMKEQNYSIISFSSREDSCLSPLAFMIHIASKMSVQRSMFGLPEDYSNFCRRSIITFTQDFSLVIFAFSSLYSFPNPQSQAFCPKSRTTLSVDCVRASLRSSPRYQLMVRPSMVAVEPSPPKKPLMMTLEMISPKTRLRSVVYCTSSLVSLTRLRPSISFSISKEILLIFSRFLLTNQKLKTSEKTFLLLFQTSPQFMIMVVPMANLKPYLLRCDFWMMQFFSGVNMCLMSRGCRRMRVTMQEVLLMITSTQRQLCFSSYMASPYSLALWRWFSSSMILWGSQGKTRTLQPRPYRVSRYHLISRFGRRWYLQQQREAHTRRGRRTARQVNMC